MYFFGLSWVAEEEGVGGTFTCSHKFSLGKLTCSIKIVY